VCLLQLWRTSQNSSEVAFQLIGEKPETRPKACPLCRERIEKTARGGRPRCGDDGEILLIVRVHSMVSHFYHLNCGTQHLVHLDSCGIVGTVVTLLHSEIFNLAIKEFASGTANPPRLANQASQPAFSQAGAERKNPGKYLCKLNQHVSHTPICISGPKCVSDVLVASFRKIKTGRTHFSPNACPQKTAVHIHPVSCMDGSLSGPTRTSAGLLA
jgi:hypothetical protein